MSDTTSNDDTRLATLWPPGTITSTGATTTVDRLGFGNVLFHLVVGPWVDGSYTWTIEEADEDTDAAPPADKSKGGKDAAKDETKPKAK